MIENEMFKFEEQICDFEEDLSNETNDIPEDIRDSILAAIGKAKLLMSQKLAQFRGLCDKNIVSQDFFQVEFSFKVPFFRTQIQRKTHSFQRQRIWLDSGIWFTFKSNTFIHFLQN